MTAQTALFAFVTLKTTDSLDAFIQELKINYALAVIKKVV